MSEPGRTILYVHPSDELYGSDRCLLEIVRHLPASDRAIVALPTDVSYTGALSRELLESGATVIHVDMLVLRRALLRPSNLPILLWRFVAGIIGLVRIIRREGVSIVHSNTLAVACGALAAGLTRTPHLWHVHEFLGDEPRLFRTLLRAMLGWAPGKVVANSKAVARSIVNGSRRRARKTTVVYNGVSRDIQRPPANGRSPDAPLTIGMLGRLAPRKGIDQALEAVAILHSRGHCIQLRVAGSAPPGQEWRLDHYQRQADELGIADCTRFTGYTNDVDAALREVDILLVPSQRPEPFGLVVIEGMAAGLPVVATRNGGGSDEILDDGVTGIYCERDPEAIADALELVLNDPQLRSALARNAVSAVQSRFSIERYTSQMLHAYDKLTVSGR